MMASQDPLLFVVVLLLSLTQLLTNETTSH
jgi:hypothetical protein